MVVERKRIGDAVAKMYVEINSLQAVVARRHTRSEDDKFHVIFDDGMCCHGFATQATTS